MKKINIPMTKFNPESPSDLTVIKDIPKAIREKAQELMNVLLSLEESKVNSSIQETLSYFPFVKSIFIQGNGQIPDALYVKRGESWVGYGNYNYLPVIDERSKDGDRVTIHGKTYELTFSGELKIWVEQPEITPVLFYDFFELPTDFVSHDLGNQGIGDKNILMNTSNVSKDDRYFVPYLKTSSNSRTHTNNPLPVGDKFTFTAMYNSIGREYYDGTENVIAPENMAVLMYIRDEFENVKIGICYDKDNVLHYFDKTVKTSMNKSLQLDAPTQLSIQLHCDTVKIVMNDLVIFTTENNIIKNKNLIFSLCNDINYGQYANGAAIVGEPMVFFDVLSNRELGLLIDKPRSFYFNSQFNTYLDLSISDKIALKKFMQDKRLTLNNNNLEKEFYLQELKLVSLYETEVSYGIADPSYRESIKTYLSELKSGITENLQRPSILNEYK